MCDGPASIIPSFVRTCHLMYLSRFGLSETNGLEALGQGIPSLSKAGTETGGPLTVVPAWKTFRTELAQLP
jgi:hypothetical protein